MRFGKYSGSNSCTHTIFYSILFRLQIASIRPTIHECRPAFAYYLENVRANLCDTAGEIGTLHNKGRGGPHVFGGCWHPTMTQEVVRKLIGSC